MFVSFLTGVFSFPSTYLLSRRPWVEGDIAVGRGGLFSFVDFLGLQFNFLYLRMAYHMLTVNKVFDARLWSGGED